LTVLHSFPTRRSSDLIQEMVESGDRWENESEIADTYLNNMGAYYGSEKNWETFQKFAFEAALTRTDVVVQPRQSNTWGALSLDQDRKSTRLNSSHVSI